MISVWSAGWVASGLKTLASKKHVPGVLQTGSCVVVKHLRHSRTLLRCDARCWCACNCARLPSAILAFVAKASKLAPAMLLLKLIHDVAQGPDFASPEGAEQLARFVAGCKEAVYLQETGRVDDSWVEHPSLDEARLRVYTRVTLEAFAHFSEDRDRFIECMERENNVLRQMRQFQFDMWQIEMQRKRELQRKRERAVELPLALLVALRRAPQMNVAGRVIAEFL